MAEADGVTELERVRQEHAEHLKKTEKWKEQVKAITDKDRREIARLKHEVELLTSQVTSMGAIARERESTIARLRKEAEEVRGKASSIGSMQQALSHALEAKESALVQLKKRDAELAAQRQRINDLSSEVDSLRVQLTGSDYLDAGSDVLVFHKRVSHSISDWLLCSVEDRPARWFEVDNLVARFGADVLARVPQDESTRPKLNRDGAGDQLRVQEVLTSLEAAREEIKRLSKSKHDELQALRERVEELERMQEMAAPAPSDDQSVSDCCRTDVEAQLREKFREEIEGLQEENAELSTQLEEIQTAHKRVVDEFAQYRKRVLRSQSASMGAGDSAGSTVAADVDRLRTERAALKQRVSELEDRTELLTKKLADCTEEKEALSTQLQQACEAVEESERVRHTLRLDLSAAEAAQEQHTARLQQELDRLNEALVHASAPKSPPPPSRNTPQVCGECKRLKHSLAEERTAHAATRASLAASREAAAYGTGVAPAVTCNDPALCPPTPPAIVVTPTSPVVEALSNTTTSAMCAQNEVPEKQHVVLDDKELRQLLDDLDDQAGFDVDDLVAVAGEQAERQELAWCAQRLKRALRELKEAKIKVADLQHAADQNRSLRAQVSDLRVSLKRQDSAQSLDYIKSTVVNFCKAKEQPDVQAALVPLLSTLLSLSDDEKTVLFQLYPLQ